MEKLIDAVNVNALLGSGSGLAPILEDLVTELQEKFSGWSHVARPFEGQVRVRTAFGQERITTTETVPFTLMLDIDWSKGSFESSSVVAPEERNLIHLGKKTL